MTHYTPPSRAQIDEEHRARLGFDKAAFSAISRIAELSNQDWSEKRIDPNDTLDQIHAIAAAALYPEK